MLLAEINAEASASVAQAIRQEDGAPEPTPQEPASPVSASARTATHTDTAAVLRALSEMFADSSDSSPSSPPPPPPPSVRPPAQSKDEKKKRRLFGR